MVLPGGCVFFAPLGFPKTRTEKPGDDVPGAKRMEPAGACACGGLGETEETVQEEREKASPKYARGC